MKRILVTGGAGFIGSHLCTRLVHEGNDVICMDNYFTGTKENILHLAGLPNFEMVRHDVTLPYYTEVDEIYNLACPASPIHYQHNPIKTFRTSVVGALNILDIAKENGAKVLQASTSEVYGDPVQHPQVETYWGNVNPTGIRSCYDEGKRGAETLFMDYHKQHGFPIKIVRIFNTYGPNMRSDDGRVISNFIIQALKNEDITIYGNGQQTRSFQYIDNLVDGLIKTMATPDSFTGPLNLGNPNEFTILDLAHKIIDMIDTNSKIIFEDLPEDDPKQRQPDIGLAQELIGYNPSIKLEDGLIKTIEYFKAKL